ncbi:hypothetical protein, partial [Lactococcus lactis]|uniref:hypothetical protein n=1 Tax=Lactococcus lactis TaxID=1358 RepID=UPI00288F950E
SSVVLAFFFITFYNKSGVMGNFATEPFLSYKKKKKEGRFSSSEIVPLFSKTMDERIKIREIFGSFIH